MGKEINDRDETLVLENTINLKKFAPKLRKLAKFLLESDKPMTISDACRELNLNRASIGTLIWKEKQKGNDFNKFIDEQAKMILHAGKAEVYKALQKGAVSDSHQDRKLYFQLTGDLKEEQNISVNNLTIGINITGTRPSDTEHEPGIIDINPVIPEDD